MEVISSELVYVLSPRAGRAKVRGDFAATSGISIAYCVIGRRLQTERRVNNSTGRRRFVASAFGFCGRD